MKKKKKMPEKMDLKSMDVGADNRTKLKQLFPSVFTETKNKNGELVESIDFERLKAELGTYSDIFEKRRERYGMDWPGKKDCMKLIQKPSVATLKPCREESVNFDDTENLFIEGDNLEVLKLLQKSYYGKIKMIYIDPPYNTGKEFIYPDNYSESLETYLAYAGLVDDEGKKFSTNTPNEGRFHTKWLNMMLPRLILAINLLRDDGVIFISIDDNELTNLRKLSDEIFGEENFIGLFVINSSPSAIDYGHLAKVHDYAVFYAKNISETVTYQIPEENKKFKYRDETGSFNLYPLYHGNVAFNPETRKNLYYPFYLNPKNKLADEFFEIGLEKREGWVKIYPVISRKDGIQRVWRWSKKKAKNELNQEIVGYKTESGEYRIVQKTRHTGKVIRSLFNDKAVSSRRGTGDLEKLFDSKVFSFPKPIDLIKRFVRAGTADEDIVLDFFAGSGPTSHAVLDLNQEDCKNRKFILVQLPEPCENTSEATKLGYQTIAEICKERIRRVIKKIKEEQSAKVKEAKEKLPGMAEDIPDLDLGFKVLKLDKSNFKIWDGSKPNASEEDISKQLEMFVEHIDPKATQEDILYELLLKAGYLPTEKIKETKMADKTVYSISEGSLLVCLEDEITSDLINAVADSEPRQFICLDRGFQGNDQLKANAVQTFAALNQNREKAEQIIFRTV